MKKIKIGDKSVSMVPPGNMVVSKGSPQILAATLGSCVGLAMFDKTNKIGGLIHVVLPRSLSKSQEVASLCAENAVDLLLNEMVRQGANKESIVAGLCGGFNMNVPMLDEAAIESVKIIKNNLKEEGIPITYLEPIEHLRRSFVLDLTKCTFACKDLIFDQIKDTKDSVLDDKIEDILYKVKPIPAVILKVIDLISREVYQVTEIVEELKKDEVMTARLLKFCNSPIFSPVKKVDSIEKAVIFLGSRNLLNIILSVYMEDFFSDCPGYSLNPKGMYNHVLAVAIISQKICELLDLPKDVGYTCGLLHDIGKRVLEFFVCNNKRRYYKELMKGIPSIVVEKNLFGYDHVEIGTILGEKWNFPKNILDTIKYHHEVTHDMNPLIRVIYIANILAHHLLPEFVIGNSCVKNFEEIINSLNLNYTHLNGIIETIPYKTFTDE